ncbi:hypothetical protein ASPACDRAFT_61139 [Aspergillus aculeatus ATCC 16872]|uniref:Uncharacterized protein n=1 Tax=Aspergillus aculeatus (strain ATCC 16872 / CBS 172.66 / WB 5094) TaxID=690307 RepID=A0A1L9WT17_ASPA1|nr:uncharacterized protein ASPACDRAFT_61139 [Aspergillus aculeatus ATCC 16872]OJJ99356.1 hypothetical protein ASPACDRAFT_61139 [Aspergillus aculeatus ATCC 16872]
MNRKALKALISKLQSRSVAFLASAMEPHHPQVQMASTLLSQSEKNNDETAALASSASTCTASPKELYCQPNYAKLILDAFCSGQPVSCMCLQIKSDRLRDHLRGPYPTNEGIQFRADDIEYVFHLLEGMSRCEACLHELPSMAQLHGLSSEAIERYRLFYQSLHRAFFSRGCDTHHEALQIDMYCSFAVEQMERMAASIGRIVEALSAEPRFDQDAWYVVSNQAERLMTAATTLQDRTEQAARV